MQIRGDHKLLHLLASSFFLNSNSKSFFFKSNCFKFSPRRSTKEAQFFIGLAGEVGQKCADLKKKMKSILFNDGLVA